MMVNNENCWLKDSCNQCKCNSVCMRHIKLNYLYNYANIPISKRKRIALRADEDGTDIQEFTELSKLEGNILNFVDNGDSLFIYSNQCGNGKTSWSYRLIQSYFHKIWPTTSLKCRGLFINVPQFLLALKDNISEKNDFISDIKDNILTADIVVWDDIATKTITPFESENLLSMIESRISAGKSNIFTSNLSGEELKKCLGDRLSSRINGSTYVIELHGKDKRGL